jgi:hypothetical protein
VSRSLHTALCRSLLRWLFGWLRLPSVRDASTTLHETRASYATCIDQFAPPALWARAFLLLHCEGAPTASGECDMRFGYARVLLDRHGSETAADTHTPLDDGGGDDDYAASLAHAWSSPLPPTQLASAQRQFELADTTLAWRDGRFVRASPVALSRALCASQETVRIRLTVIYH